VSPISFRTSTERGRLARAGRAGHQHHAVRVQDRGHQVGFRLRLEPELRQVEGQVALVENTQHDLLAEEHRQHRHTEVDDAVPHLQLQAAVLRHPPLGDVELGEDLDARGEGRLHPERGLHHLEQRAVDPVADPQLELEGLDVDVARPPADGVGQEAVDELDDRRVVDLRLGGRLVFQLLDDLDVLALPLHVLQDFLELLVAALVVPLDDRPEGVLPGQDREDIVPGDELQILDQAHVGRIGHRHGQRPPLALERQHHLLGGEIAGNQLEDLGIDVEPREVHRRHPVLPGEDLGDLDLGDQPQPGEDVPEPLPRGALLRERLITLLACQESLADQHFTELLGPGGQGGGHACAAPQVSKSW